MGELVVDAPAARRENRSPNRAQVAAKLAGDLRHRRDELPEDGVACDEICFRIDFDESPARAFDRDSDKPFGGDLAGSLRRCGEPFLAQPVDRRFEVAVRLL
jgi:hypothetical protein